MTEAFAEIFTDATIRDIRAVPAAWDRVAMILLAIVAAVFVAEIVTTQLRGRII
ncbi:MAG TPA: hypothetical protein VMS22_02080 [Candidatus Eisenbacteria bacterium]|nr:hypothetical protein [Candidatus Eisenbacteria bacterium]